MGLHRLHSYAANHGLGINQAAYDQGILAESYRHYAECATLGFTINCQAPSMATLDF